jgi:NAD(P)-dependent dehydrogenase (short-subunit alcohol dehydrogenase family)
MATAVFAHELRETPIKINAVTPGLVATELGGMNPTEIAKRPGTVTPEEAAELIARYATLPDDGPTGGFFGKDGPERW